jgi:hypothetical protein
MSNNINIASERNNITQWTITDINTVTKADLKQLTQRLVASKYILGTRDVKIKVLLKKALKRKIFDDNTPVFLTAVRYTDIKRLCTEFDELFSTFKALIQARQTKYSSLDSHNRLVMYVLCFLFHIKCKRMQETGEDSNFCNEGGFGVCSCSGFLNSCKLISSEYDYNDNVTLTGIRTFKTGVEFIYDQTS